MPLLIYSKAFLRFGLAQIPRIILPNQLALIKCDICTNEVSIQNIDRKGYCKP